MKNKTFTFKSSPDDNTGTQVVNLEGDLGIRNAVQIKKMLETFEIHSDIIAVNLRKVEKVDITTIQNLIAFRDLQKTNNRKTDISAKELDKESVKLLINSGFGKFFNLVK